uniref:Phosphatidic acid phosphatase type 2/haloperoxidase domain-containing protein n=1 Tax=Neogobius melanostomus TaxID=47308 RepID=A0A8C6SVE9_9GOBI
MWQKKSEARQKDKKKKNSYIFFHLSHNHFEKVVILVATLMLVYYCEFTDTFRPVLQGFVCRDPDLSKPFPGPEQGSRVQPVFLYSVVGGLPVISAVELVMFLLHNSGHLYDQDKVVMVADCCYVNPMVRRTFRFLGVYAFGLFCTDIFVNAAQLVTGSLAPHFLSVCQPNYTALSCRDTPQFISQPEACTGPPPEVTRARKSFPCKEAAVSLYTAVYMTMYVMSCVGCRAGRLSAPLLSLTLITLALLTGFNRVAEYRNHWRDVLSGQAVGPPSWSAWGLYFPSRWSLQCSRITCFAGFLVRGSVSSENPPNNLSCDHCE